MTKPILYRARVVAGIGERMAATVAQHVGVDGRQPGALSDALEVTVDGVRRERAATLSGEDEGVDRELSAQFSSARTSSPSAKLLAPSLDAAKAGILPR